MLQVSMQTEAYKERPSWQLAFGFLHCMRKVWWEAVETGAVIEVTFILYATCPAIHCCLTRHVHVVQINKLRHLKIFPQYYPPLQRSMRLKRSEIHEALCQFLLTSSPFYPSPRYPFPIMMTRNSASYCSSLLPPVIQLSAIASASN